MKLNYVLTTFFVALVCAGSFYALPAFAQSPGSSSCSGAPQAGEDEAASSKVSGVGPLFWEVLGHKIQPVSGADGLIHLSYPAVFTNNTAYPVTLKSIEVVDPAGRNQPTGTNQVVSMSGKDVTGQFFLFSLPKRFETDLNYSSELGPGQAASVYFDVTYRDRASVPRCLSHRVAADLTLPTGEKTEYVVTDDPVPVAQRDPIILTPPLRGDGWVDGNGCCKQIGPHRGFFSAIDGALWPAEEFSIDFVRINAQGVGFTGDPNKVKSYFYYGDGVFAAGAGTVIEVVRDLPDQVPNDPSIVTTVETAAGNHVIIDMSEGRYALYAHLQPNSPTVQVGDSVYQGQQLGLLGNSGNTTAPHLHFEIMDRPNTLKAHGLPFVFDKMRLEGEISGSMDQFGDQYFAGVPLTLDRSRNSQVNGTMPLTLDVVSF
jgi:hypothetical protein